MTLATLLLPVALLAQQRAPAEALRALVERGSDSALVASVSRAPAAAREAMQALLDRTARPEGGERALAGANRLAGAMALALADSFPLRQVMRYAAWTPEERQAKVAIDSIRFAGNAALGREGFEAALRAWRESARRAEVLGDTAGVAAATGNIGAGFYAEGMLDSAETYFARAARLARQAHDGRTELNAQGGLANVLRDRGAYREARDAYLRTLALRERIGDVRGIAADRNNLGVLAMELGDEAGARAAFEEALAVSRRHQLREPMAASLTNLAGLADETADYEAATARYQEALALYRELGDRAGEGAVLRSLGLVALRRGDYAAARERLEAAVALHRRAGPAASLAQAQADLARVALATGELQEARVQLERARRTAARPGIAPEVAGDVALARGDAATEFNAWADADAAYREADAHFLRAGDVAGRARARHGLGYLRFLDGDAARAVPELEAAVVLQESVGDAREAALVRLDLAAAEAKAGRRARARAALAAARDTLRGIGDAVGEAVALAGLAELELAEGRPAAAESLVREGLARLGPRAAPSVAGALQAGLGDALAAQGAASAGDAYRAAARLYERAAGTLWAPERRADWLADKWEVYERLARFESARGRDSAAFEASERLRARMMLDELGRGRVAWSGGADSAEVRREQELRRAIAELARRLEPRENALLALRGAADPPASPGIAREALDRAEAQYAQLLLGLRERAPRYAALVEGRAPGWREVAARLPASAALLEYLVTDSAATLFVVRADGVRAIDLGSDRRTIASMVEFARGTLAKPSGETSRAVLVRLHQLLVAPAEASGALRGAERLLVVPHAELHYLPFAALRAPGPEGRYLVERYELATVPSAAAWLAIAARERPLPRNPRVLALAPRTAQLPGTRREVEAIRALGPERTTVLAGAQATTAGLTRALKGHDVVHLATYGVLNRRNPLFSHVELAPAPGDDGRLAVHDVYGLPLDARLVVLSACQTALGSGYRADVPAGDEWVGLSQAFLAAGASRVVATLWLVDDRATAELMARLHEGLAGGRDAAAALAAAQRRAIGDARLRDPFFWAGVTLVGGL